MSAAGHLAGHGLEIRIPDRWEARLYRRDAVTDGVRTRRRFAAHPAANGHPGESMNPVLHLGNFALPPERGDFGTGAVERMGARQLFVSLLEYDTEEAGRALFAATGLPRPAVRDFAPNALQRRLPGQLGCQRFFTAGGRAFCLYVVLGSRSAAPALVAELGDALDGITIIPAAHSAERNL